MPALDRPRRWASRHRLSLITSLCAVVGVILGVIGFAIPWYATVTVPPLWVSFAFLAAILVAHLGRRRRPLTMLAVGALVAVVEVLATGVSGLGVLIVLSDLAYAAALYAASRVVDAVAFVCTAVSLAAAATLGVIWATAGVGALDHFSEGLFLGALITVPVLLASSIWIGRMVRYPRLEAQRERERADAVERVSMALRQDAVIRERLELSRELHDVIAGHLSAIAMQSTAALERQDMTDPVPLRRSLELVRSSSLDALTDMRIMIDVLRGDPATAAVAEAPTRLSADEIDRAVAVAEANGLEVVLSADDDAALAAVPGQISVVGLRALVEALTNVAKHAPGARTEVVVSVGAGLLSVSVVNPFGAATGPAALAGSGGVGLVGLAERARLVGGDLTAGWDGSSWRTVLHAPTGERVAS